MRMLAWVNLLQDDGYVNDALREPPLVSHPVDWLDGRPYTVVLGLVYGYVPFLILPLYAALDRIDVRLLEASRDLGVSPFRTFVQVTLPLSRQGHARRRRDHGAADVRRLLHEHAAVGVAAHEHDRQPDPERGADRTRRAASEPRS